MTKEINKICQAKMQRRNHFSHVIHWGEVAAQEGFLNIHLKCSQLRAHALPNNVHPGGIYKYPIGLPAVSHAFLSVSYPALTIRLNIKSEHKIKGGVHIKKNVSKYGVCPPTVDFLHNLYKK